MNLTLLKMDLRAYWKLMLVFSAILVLYLFVISSMYDPNGVNALAEMMKMLPEGLVKSFGMSNSAADLTGTLANFFYGFIILFFPTIYFVVVANGLIAKHVDRGSMSNLLSTPSTRAEIVTTQAVFLIASITAILLIYSIFGIILCQIMFPGELDIGAFMLMTLSSWVTFMSLSAISFCASCMFNDSGKSLTFGAGLPIAFFLMKMIGQEGDKFSWLSDISLYSLLSPAEIVNTGSLNWVPCLILIGISVIGYVGGIVIFNRKDLPI